MELPFPFHSIQQGVELLSINPAHLGGVGGGGGGGEQDRKKTAVKYSFDK